MLGLTRVCLVILLAPAVRAAVINPQHAKNITVYHVNPASFSAAPLNMNTADLNGDMYFDLRTRGLPLECGIWRNLSFWSQLDCDNPEVANVSDLAITKLVLEVDTRWADYANCNLDPASGVYSCDWQDCPDNCSALTPGGMHDGGHQCDNSNGCAWDKADSRCEPYGCPNKTDENACVHGYDTCVWDDTLSSCTVPPGPGPVCDKSKVGHLDLTTVDWGRTNHHHRQLSKIDLWHGNVLSKTNGFWYSTQPQGECNSSDVNQHYCSWRVAAVDKKISKRCSDAAINDAIVEGDKKASWGARCFDNNCTAADRSNTTSQCWIECFYANVLGKLGSSQLLNHTSPDFGIPLSELGAAWDRPFLPVKQGGCPALPSNHQAADPVEMQERLGNVFEDVVAARIVV